MRVCYLIQAHRSPRQVARLVATLGSQSPRALVLVARDVTGSPLPLGTLPGSVEVRCLDVPGPIRRGYLSMLRPWFDAVALLRSIRADYDWLVYLSGQDYPVRPLAESEAALATAEADGFVRHWPALDARGSWRRPKQGRRRYWYRYFDLPPWSAPALRAARAVNGIQGLVHIHLVYGLRLGVRALRVPFGPLRVCFAGSQWTTLRRDCAEFVLDAVQEQPELVEHYRRTICPDESLVQTLLVNAGRFRLLNDNLRFADTEGARDGHARSLGEEDLDHVTCGRYHFGRKFDLDRTPNILDRLDERLRDLAN